MIVKKWIDVRQEIEVSIGADDIRIALSEAFSVVITDRLGEEGPSQRDVLAALNSIAGFLNGMLDEHIASMSPKQRETVGKYLASAAERFKP